MWVHEIDAPLARGEVGNPAKGGGPMRIGSMVGFLWWTLRHGGLRVTHLGEVATYGDGATLDVPGSPRVLLVPGPHAGQRRAARPVTRCGLRRRRAVHVRGHDGATRPAGRPVLGRSAQEAKASLGRLEGLAATLVLPGHGDAFDGGIDEAVRLAREAPLPV